MDAPDDVRPAVPLAALLVLLLAAVPAPGRPQVLGPALAAYVVLVLALGVAAGRPVAARAEVLGLLARWAALGPRLPGWQAPRGATAVLALVLGGAWAERFTRTAAWTAQTPGTGARLLLLLLAVGLAGALALALRRPGPAVLVPLAVGAVVAGGLRRGLISAQLLRDAALAAPQPVVADPLGAAGGQLLALAVATVLGALSAVVLARRSGPAADRLPGLAVVLVGSGVTALLALQP